MAISKKLKDYLEKESVAYELHQHPITYTAAQTAGIQHIPGKQFLKAVIIKADGKYHMCVLPATYLVDFKKLKDVLGAQEVRLATESEAANIFPDYEVGAEPPIGNIHGLNIWAEQQIEKNDNIYFNGGTHTDSIKVSLKDYKRLAKPIFVNFGTRI